MLKDLQRTQKRLSDLNLGVEIEIHTLMMHSFVGSYFIMYSLV